MQKTGITILVSTPYMDEASLCDRVALMQKGSLLALDSPENIVQQYQGDLWQLSTSDMHTIIVDLSEVNSGIKNVFRFGEKVHITSDGLSQEEVSSILKEELESKGHKNIVVEAVKPQIEDCFLDLMDEN
jgi:ABC-type multidrug transport system ATPase subunit